MKRLLNLALPGMIIITAMFSCNSSNKAGKTEENPEQQQQVPVIRQAGPPVIIYKTREDYYHQVPVILNEEKSAIASYPDIRDVKRNGEYTYPTRLPEGFLLDNRGIDENVAFLELTYEEYAALEKTPSAKELIDMVLDASPLTEMYNCGTRNKYKDPEQELGKMIESGDFSDCTKLK